MSALRYLYEHNSAEDALTALAVAAAVFAALWLLRRLLQGRLRTLARRTATKLDDVAADVVDGTHRLTLLLAAIYAGANQLELGSLETRLDQLMLIALTIQGGVWLSQAALSWLRYRAQGEDASATVATHMALAGFVLRLVIWVVVVLSILSNLGFDITALVTSLGIGGVAVALAVQNILGDLFASMSIALDKPFMAGDAIVVDTFSGTVKHVGLKTTRIQADSGEEVVFSNADLLKSRIRNYKRMDERRAVFTFTLAHSTPTEQLRRIPELMREIVEAQEEARFDRTHLKALTPGGLDFEVVYFMLKPNFALFVKAQHQINLAMLERFRGEDITLATPTPAVQMVGAAAGPAAAKPPARADERPTRARSGAAEAATAGGEPAQPSHWSENAPPPERLGRSGPQ
ncbi:mechanosensitive ion channel family protein [Chitinimonas koreensis]|uniref:mechanosensitive ion channel family protein n=1 Tax=Chitinimonas koreensis TaxID=356302 RepID=UPI000409E659|nr:mechanosensitive ion channel family protein [Chitinimonas koreensis]QNM97327.1 mechanosensitive ion channel family protein [Chitinimonas koreensis]